MKYLFLLVLLLPSIFVLAHDIPATYFTLFENEHIMELEIEFDRADMDKALQKEKNVDGLSKTQLLKQYLHKHIVFKFNGNQAPMKILSIKNQGHHVFVKATLKKTGHPIKKIDFKTTFLLVERPDQNNILTADVNCITRGFRLSKKRMAILVEY